MTPDRQTLVRLERQGPAACCHEAGFQQRSKIRYVQLDQASLRLWRKGPPACKQVIARQGLEACELTHALGPLRLVEGVAHITG
jgi:hypothetical protein